MVYKLLNRPVAMQLASKQPSVCPNTYPGPSCCRWCTCWPGPGGWRGCLAGRRVPAGRRGCSIEGSSQGWCPCQAHRCRTSHRTVRTARHSGEGRATPCTGKMAYKKDTHVYRQTDRQTQAETETVIMLPVIYLKRSWLDLDYSCHSCCHSAECTVCIYLAQADRQTNKLSPFIISVDDGPLVLVTCNTKH